MIKKLKTFLFQNPIYIKYFNNDDRGSFRNRRILYTTLSALGAKSVTILVSLLSVPLTYNYLNAERFGMMMTIVSLVGTVSFADLGIGFGLQNRWAELSLDKTGEQIKKAISTVFFFLLGVSFFLFVLGTYFYVHFDLSILLNLKNRSIESGFVREVNNSILVFFILTVITLPFSIVQKIQIGKQEGYRPNLWNIVANIVSLILLIIFTYFQLGIPFIILALYGVNNLFLILNYFHEFYFRNNSRAPSLIFWEVTFLKKMLADGVVAFINQLGAMTLTVTNNIFLANFLGGTAVAEYNIGYRLITLMLIPLESILPYLTPGLNEAFATNDVAWVKNAIKKSLKFAVISSLITFCIIFFGGKLIIKLWLNREDSVSPNIVMAFSIFSLFFANIGCVISFLMLSTKFIRYKAKIYAFAILVSTVCKYYVVQQYGTEGLIYTVTFCMFVFFVIPSFLIIKNHLNEPIVPTL